MDKKFENLRNELRKFDELLSRTEPTKDEILDQLASLLEQVEFDSDMLSEYKRKIDRLDVAKTEEKLEKFKKFDKVDYSEREKFLQDFEVELTSQRITSDEVFLLKQRRRITNFSKFLIGALLILIGVGLIVLPLGDEIKVFTIFYFTPNDGVTLIDVVGLIFILSGIVTMVSPSKAKT